MTTDSTDETNITKRKTPPYWWPDVTALMQLFLSASIVGMVGYILHQLLEDKLTLEQAQRDLLMILFGIILGCFKDVYGYTFGSSAGSKRQGEIITQSLEAKDKIIAGNNAALAAGPSVDALTAATIVAPAAAAAAAAAPPAADVAAPPAAREAVASMLAEKGITPQPKETP